MILIVGARIDAKLNLHVFNRLMRLPLDYFERNPAGEILSMTGLQVNKIREFITGKLMTTMLDLITLLVLLPLLFLPEPPLAWIVLVCAALIADHPGFLRPLSRLTKRWIDAETAKSSVLGETFTASGP